MYAQETIAREHGKNVREHHVSRAAANTERIVEISRAAAAARCDECRFARDLNHYLLSFIFFPFRRLNSRFLHFFLSRFPAIIIQHLCGLSQTLTLLLMNYTQCRGDGKGVGV